MVSPGRGERSRRSGSQREGGSTHNDSDPLLTPARYERAVKPSPQSGRQQAGIYLPGTYSYSTSTRAIAGIKDAVHRAPQSHRHTHHMYTDTLH